MSKPRYPLSVERHFCYRAKLNNGDMLETQDFKTLYRRALSVLRTEVLYNETEYKYAYAVLEFGYCTEYEIKKGYWYSEWTSIKDFGCLQVSTLSECFYSTNDESNHLLRGEFECVKM